MAFRDLLNKNADHCPSSIKGKAAGRKEKKYHFGGGRLSHNSFFLMLQFQYPI